MRDDTPAKALKDGMHIYEYINEILKSRKLETGPKIGSLSTICITICANKKMRYWAYFVDWTLLTPNLVGALRRCDSDL